MSTKPEPSRADLIKYEIDRRKMFKTTIVIAAMYGVIAVILLLFLMFSGDGGNVLANEFSTFTITLVGGMMFVLILLVIQIVTFRPVSTQTSILKSDICPDYWVLQQTPETDPEYVGASSEVKAQMKYQCVPDPAVWNYMKPSGSPTGNDLATFNASVTNIMGHVMPAQNTSVVNLSPDVGKPKTAQSILASRVSADVYNVNAYKVGGAVSGFPGGSSNIRCDKVFPVYMATKDVEMFPQSQNELRCKYSKECKIPWTGVCPSGL